MNRLIVIFLLILLQLSFVAIASSAVTIDAQVVRNQTGSGQCLISSGFPLPEGLLTEQMIQSGLIKILVNGVEVPANVSGLRGRHQDGTLRSILIQFNYALSQNQAIPAKVVINDGTRNYPDPPYQLPTLATIRDNNIILPTSVDYLCSTRLTLRNLLPKGQGTPNEEALYTNLAENRFDALSVSEYDGTASYENVSAMLGLWCRSADIKYQKEAVKKTLGWLPYNTPKLNNNPACLNESVVNPDNRDGGQACGIPAEWQFARVLSYAQMYLLTGYRDFWGYVSFITQYQVNSITNQTAADINVIKNTQYDRPRFNYAQRYGALIAALMIDATYPVDYMYFTGKSGRVVNWEEQLNWTLNAIENSAWDLKWIPFNNGTGTVPVDGATISQGGVSASLLGVYPQMNYAKIVAGNQMPAVGYLQINKINEGSFSSGVLTGISAIATGIQQADYRQGMTGTRSNSPLPWGSSVWPNEPTRVEQPSFQLIFPTNFLIDYYLYIKSDSRVPGLVKKNLDIILKNIRLMKEGDTYFRKNGGVWGNPIYGKPYNLENPPSNDDATPYELPEYARIIAFVLKTMGDDTVNGASYSTWYNRCVDTSNVSPVNILTWQWKLFGQFYGWGQDAPWMMAQASLLNFGPSAMRVPTQWNTILGSTPDINRKSMISAPTGFRIAN